MGLNEFEKLIIFDGTKIHFWVLGIKKAFFQKNVYSELRVKSSNPGSFGGISPVVAVRVNLINGWA